MNNLRSLPVEWDVDAVREFYAKKGMDLDKLGPRHVARFVTFEEDDAESEMFYREYAEFLAMRAQR